MCEFVKIGASFVLGALTAVFAEPLRRWLFRVKLGLAFKAIVGLGTGNICITPTGDPNVKEACYVRVSVKTCNRLIRVVAQSCQVFLVKIEKRISASRYETIYNDPLPLAWSYFGHNSRDIPPGIEFFFDVIATNIETNLLIPQTTQQPTVWSSTNVLTQPARYKFTVAVSGENVRTATLQIWIDWKGQWNSFTVGTNGHPITVTPQLVESVRAGGAASPAGAPASA
jgi:hypothetical protein